MTRRPVLAVAAVVLLAPGARAADGPARSPAKVSDRPRDRVFVGYLYGAPKDLNFGLYTHLCHAFLTADGDGRLRPARGVPSRELADAAHKAGVKVLVSLGGWGWDRQFAKIVSDRAAEDRYVSAVMEAVTKAGYDGIDLDWEYPDTAEEVAGFERLTRRFRALLDEAGAKRGTRMFLTMAAAANPGTLRWLGKDFLLETMDWVNVMTYDMAGPWLPYAGHNSPLYPSSKPKGPRPPSVEATFRYLLDERGIPADRLALGIPLYGRAFAAGEPYAATPKAQAKDAPRVRLPQGNYSNLHRLLNAEHWTRLWDDETKTPWLVDPDHSVVVGYDDAESVGIKTEWAAAKGLRGVFFWQVNGDRLPDGSNPLQEASKRVWEKGASSKPAK